MITFNRNRQRTSPVNLELIAAIISWYRRERRGEERGARKCWCYGGRSGGLYHTTVKTTCLVITIHPESLGFGGHLL